LGLGPTNVFLGGGKGAWHCERVVYAKSVVGERFVIQNAPLLNNHSKAKKSFKHFIKNHHIHVHIC
jgi:hypothetical protein